MKRTIHIVILLCLVLCSCNQEQDRVSLIREKLLNCDQSSVIVTAHRGDWRNFPENSLEAIESAIKMGVDIVELDVQCTKDGHLILMHDSRLDRTTTGKGQVSEVTLDSISKLNLKNGCNIRTIHKVPTLKEALMLAKGKIMINLDKADRYFDKVYELTKETGTTHQIIMKGKKDIEQIKTQYGDYSGEMIYMPIVDLDKEGAEQNINLFIDELKPVAFELLYVNDSNPLPKKLKTSLNGRTLIWYNTLWDTMAGGHDDDMSLKNLDDGYGYLIDELGARIIQTDRPAMLLEYLRKRGLHN